MTVSEQSEFPQQTLHRIVSRLAEKYQGIFAAETIERVVFESYASLLRQGFKRRNITNFTEKFSFDRLRALATAKVAWLKRSQKFFSFVFRTPAGHRWQWHS